VIFFLLTVKNFIDYDVIGGETVEVTYDKVLIHELIDVVVTILDARDPCTFIHSWRVADLSVLISKCMGLPKDVIDRIHIAAHLHDIGKIGVSDRILNKPGKLNREERFQIQAHPRIGYNIFKRLPIFEDIALIVLHHHERFDGQGYPYGLKGEEIPLESRIISVVDAFDAISSDRPYRKAKSYEVCIDEINQHSGSQFCPEVVQCLSENSHLIPWVPGNFWEKAINHFAFVGHEELMHSRRLV